MTIAVSIAGALGIVAASLTAIAVVVRLGARPLYRMVRTIEEAVRALAPDDDGRTQLDRIAARLAVVEGRSAQLIPNGGSSLRDDVKALREELATHLAHERTERSKLWGALAHAGFDRRDPAHDPGEEVRRT